MGRAGETAGNFYFVERSSCDSSLGYYCGRLMRKVDAKTGILTTIAGGPDALTSLNGPIAVDAAGDVFFVTSDLVTQTGITAQVNDRVYRIDAITGAITHVAGRQFDPSTDPLSETVDLPPRRVSHGFGASKRMRMAICTLGTAGRIAAS